MTKTQIQLPDNLYREVKRIANEQEWSLAEVLRRGAEHMVNVYPPRHPTTQWQLPKGRNLGRIKISHEDWREIANERNDSK